MKEKNEISHFNRMATDYDRNYSYDTEFTRQKIKNKCQPLINDLKGLNTTSNVLEIGCGTGEYTRIVASAVPKLNILGLDISPGIIKVAKEKCKNNRKVAFTVASAYNTGIEKNSIDYVFGFYILHHLDIDAVAKELNRILKPGGRAYFYEPNILNPIVYIIKSNKAIKKQVGDSPDEWALNPLTVKKLFLPLKVQEVLVTEFTPPVRFISSSILLKLDKILSHFSKVPLINFLGGSVLVKLVKSKSKK